MNRMAAWSVAKAEAVKDLNPWVFGGLLIAGGVLLIMSGLGSGRSGGDQRE